MQFRKTPRICRSEIGPTESTNEPMDGPEGPIGSGQGGETFPSPAGGVGPNAVNGDQAGRDCPQDAGTCVLAPPSDAPSCPGCSINGACVAPDAIDLESPCRICDPVRDALGWSANEGVTCEDGLCTINDACVGGECVGQARTCEDGVACNGVSACDEAADACTPDANSCQGVGEICDVASGTCVTTCAGCLIQNVCVANNSEAAGNPCLVCNPSLSTTAFSPAVGKSCGFAPAPCSQQDTCDAAGRCQPNDLLEGTPCGSSASGDCNQPDSCDGNGACLQRLCRDSRSL